MKMTFYCQHHPDGTIHVTNIVDAYRGQHHRHTPSGFDDWRQGITDDALDWDTLKSCRPCKCSEPVDRYPIKRQGTTT